MERQPKQYRVRITTTSTYDLEFPYTDKAVALADMREECDKPGTFVALEPETTADGEVVETEP